MAEQAESLIKSIPELSAALYKAGYNGDFSEVARLLLPIVTGEIIETGGIKLRVVDPTDEERELLKKAETEGIEYGLITAGKTSRVVRGKEDGLNEVEVLQIITELTDKLGDKSFSHTHWDNRYSPTPSPSDVPVFDQVTDKFGYECRVVSWLPGEKVFVYLGRA